MLRLEIEYNSSNDKMKLNFKNKDISVIKGSLHLANIGITNIEKKLWKYWDCTQDLAECNSRKH